MDRDLSSLESFIQERMSQTKLAGLSLAVIEGGEVSYSRGFGLRDLERGLPATARTLFGIGSITKSFTCLAIMQLQEEGRLSVDDPVDRFLPLKVKPHGETVLIRHLMSHTSGIPALAYLENVLRYHYGAVSKFLPLGSTADMLTFVNGAQEWAFTRPGERHFYLNEGFVLLGGIIEKITGIPYARYVQEQILDPLGMTRSTFDPARFDADDDAAVPYATNLEGRHLAKSFPWGQGVADAGLVSNAEDMARYAAMYLGGGKGIVSQASLDAMAAPQVAGPAVSLETGEPASQYGFGLATSELFGRRMVGHGGMVYGATAHMGLLPEQGLGVVTLANGSGYAMANIASAALALLVGADPWALPALRTERILTGLTGAYETYRSTFGAAVRRQGDFLMLEFKSKLSEQTVPLVPIELSPERSRFFTLALGRRMELEFISAGGQVELIYERYRFRRTGLE